MTRILILKCTHIICELINLPIKNSRNFILTEKAKELKAKHYPMEKSQALSFLIKKSNLKYRYIMVINLRSKLNSKHIE